MARIVARGKGVAWQTGGRRAAMKRLLVLVLSASAAAALVACEGRTAKPAKRVEAPSGPTAAQLAFSAAMADREKSMAARSASAAVSGAAVPPR